MYRAYFIGGPDDLTVRTLAKALPSFEVALLRPIGISTTPRTDNYVRPRRGRYVLLGRGRSRGQHETLIYEWDGEVV